MPVRGKVRTQGAPSVRGTNDPLSPQHRLSLQAASPHYGPWWDPLLRGLSPCGCVTGTHSSEDPWVPGKHIFHPSSASSLGWSRGKSPSLSVFLSLGRTQMALPNGVVTLYKGPLVLFSPSPSICLNPPTHYLRCHRAL